MDTLHRRGGVVGLLDIFQAGQGNAAEGRQLQRFAFQPCRGQHVVDVGFAQLHGRKTAVLAYARCVVGEIQRVLAHPEVRQGKVGNLDTVAAQSQQQRKGEGELQQGETIFIRPQGAQQRSGPPPGDHGHIVVSVTTP
jgi:hypothetical protein